MASVIRGFDYSKARGRGRGILGMKDFDQCRKPGAGSVETSSEAKGKEGGDSGEKCKPRGMVLFARCDYQANSDSPGGFKELPLRKGQLLELVSEHSDNEHWWEVKNEDNDIGFVPSSRVTIRDDQALPWLVEASLKSEEEERKVRVKRLAQEKAALEGDGFGPSPKDLSSLPPKKYVSAYKREEGGQSSGGGGNFYCEVCDKKLNGPKPYQAHMASKAHKEELALLES